jgi:hypothetical protein
MTRVYAMRIDLVMSLDEAQSDATH